MVRPYAGQRACPPPALQLHRQHQILVVNKVAVRHEGWIKDCIDLRIGRFKDCAESFHHRTLVWRQGGHQRDKRGLVHVQGRQTITNQKLAACGFLVLQTLR